jgi:2'-5' RNA ligase
MPRLFTGIEIPEDIVQDLSALRGGVPGARWIDPDNYHMTLRFIGDVDGATARDVMQILGSVRRAPFEVVLDRLDQFGGKKPRAVFAGATPKPALIELQAEHERLLQRIGLPPEQRKFAPHVTLARLRDASAHHVADYLSSRGPFRTPPFRVDRFVLFSSKASTGGGPYVVEAAYPLVASGNGYA